ncbi:hypothetical protein [Lignipirellula cremea]|uniref:Uncharacterized protein n=1 Tax=Lignipirellula cremea TaxID=2528010 RepID=A0A518E0U0_9BACT|nr:hypothetical protein [Lignipirellula cremea]QDU97699.1 hypothetical protein Pla8534_55520 [Lignipirellula cremea]
MRFALSLTAATLLTAISTGPLWGQADGLRLEKTVSEALDDGPEVNVDYSRRQGVHLSGDTGKGPISDHDGVVDVDINGTNDPDGPIDIDLRGGADLDRRVRAQSAARLSDEDPIFSPARPAAVPQQYRVDPRTQIHLEADNWRYRFHNGMWWYWMPNQYWAVHTQGEWHRYAVQ